MTSAMTPASTERDIRLDFVRGLALMIIFINHIPGNEGQFLMLSRYGWSDAAEIFVFCSGYVSALVFGRGLDRAGLWVGTARILSRCGQIYTVHLALFLALAVSCVIGNELFPGHDYVQQLNIRYLFDHAEQALLSMVTLSYLPNSIDILPMYLVLLAWVPVFWSLSRLDRSLAWGVSIAVYLSTYLFHLELSAQPESERAWFFNPFAWQLIFFAGYTLGAGWLRVPLGRKRGLFASLAIIVLAVPFSHEALLRPFDWMTGLYGYIDPLYEKTRLGPLRLIHFAALAYVMATLLGRHREWLQNRLATHIRVIGQNSLAIFSVGLLLAWISGMLLDLFGHGVVPLLWVNLGGLTLLLTIGQCLHWLDGKPWNVRSPSPVEVIHRGGAAVVAGPSGGPTLMLRPLSVGLLVLPLAIAPFFLPKKPVATPVTAAQSVAPGGQP
jgi:hypothetical protein